MYIVYCDKCGLRISKMEASHAGALEARRFCENCTEVAPAAAPASVPVLFKRSSAERRRRTTPAGIKLNAVSAINPHQAKARVVQRGRIVVAAVSGILICGIYGISTLAVKAPTANSNTLTHDEAKNEPSASEKPELVTNTPGNPVAAVAIPNRDQQPKPASGPELRQALPVEQRFQTLGLNDAATASSAMRLFAGKSDVEKLVPPQWGRREVDGVPFDLAAPESGHGKNIIVLFSPRGAASSVMPQSVKVTCGNSAKAIHLLSGIAGWGFPATPAGLVAMNVRITYADGQTEDHALINGEHFADYIRRVDVPKSQFAFKCKSQQVRHLIIRTARPQQPVASIEFLKGDASISPVVMAVTIEK